jgi:hypothetical protein
MLCTLFLFGIANNYRQYYALHHQNNNAHKIGIQCLEYHCSHRVRWNISHKVKISTKFNLRETQTKYGLAASWFQLDSCTRLSDLKSMTKDYGVVFVIKLQDSYMIMSKGRKAKYNDEKLVHFVYVLIFSNCSFNNKSLYGINMDVIHLLVLFEHQCHVPVRIV